MAGLFDLAGKRALLTGSTRGLGAAMARALAEAGATVIVNGRDPAKVEATAAALRRDGFAAEAAAFDVTDAAAMGRAVAAAGHIDVLVNNAGIQHRGQVAEFRPAHWDELVATHLTAAFRLVQAVVPQMIERRAGKIVNVTSIIAELGRPTIVPYAAVKGGLKMLTRGLCAELARHNIQVNAIAPGYMRTDINAVLMADPEFDAWLTRRTPAGRWGEAHELAGAVVFLASAASDFVNGQTLIVDGGMTAAV